MHLASSPTIASLILSQPTNLLHPHDTPASASFKYPIPTEIGPAEIAGINALTATVAVPANGLYTALPLDPTVTFTAATLLESGRISESTILGVEVSISLPIALGQTQTPPPAMALTMNSSAPSQTVLPGLGFVKGSIACTTMV